MNINSNVEAITEQTQFYDNLSILLLLVAIVLVVAAVVIFIVFDIPHSFRVLTGVGAGRKSKKDSLKERDKEKAKISWGTSKLLKKEENEDATTVLSNDETVVLIDSDATTVLMDNDATTVLASDETTVLNTGNENLVFQMQDDIKITGSDKNI